MHIFVIILLVLAAHFNLTPFAPSPAGKAKFYWPFAADSRSWLPFIGGLPSQSGSVLTPLLAGLAGLGFVAAAASLLGWVVPEAWFRPLALGAAAASVLLYGLYAGPYTIVPQALDAVLLWGLLAQQWSVGLLRG